LTTKVTTSKLASGKGSCSASPLGWPKPRRLYLLASDGRLWLSPDVGRRWRLLGEIGGRPAAFAAYADGRLYAALHDGLIKRSNDGGRSLRLLGRTR